MSATSISNLSIAVDSRSVQPAINGISRLGAVGRDAAGHVDALGDAAGRTAGKLKNLVAGIAALAGLHTIKSSIKEVAMLAARYDTLGVSMAVAGKNAGVSAAQMRGYEKELRKTGISALESRQSLISMATANMDLAQSSRLARAAQDLAVVGNMNSSEALNRLIHGIQTGNTLTLRTLGLNLQFKEGNEELAKSLGKTVKQLTEQDKQQARVNEVLKGAAQYAGIYEASMTSAGKQLNSLKRYVEDVKVALGGAFQPALASAVEMLTGKLKGMNDALERAKVSGEMADWGNRLKTSMEIAGNVVMWTVKALWALREAVVAAGAVFALGKLANRAMEIKESVAARWQDAQLGIKMAAINKAESASLAQLNVARNISIGAKYKEAIASQQVAQKKLIEARVSGLLTKELAKEAWAQHKSSIAKLEEARKAAVSGDVGVGQTLKSFVSPVGVATAAITAGAVAWGLYRRSVEAARDEMAKMRMQALDNLGAFTESSRSVWQYEKSIKDAASGDKAKKEAQIGLNRAVRDALEKYPDLHGAIKKEGDNYKVTAEELNKLLLAKINEQILNEEKKLQEAAERSDRNYGVGGLLKNHMKMSYKFWTGRWGQAADHFGDLTDYWTHDSGKDSEAAQGALTELYGRRRTLELDAKDRKAEKKITEGASTGQTDDQKKRMADYLTGLKQEAEMLKLSGIELMEHRARKEGLSGATLGYAVSLQQEIEQLKTINSLREKQGTYGLDEYEVMMHNAKKRGDSEAMLLLLEDEIRLTKKHVAAKDNEKEMEAAIKGLRELDAESEEGKKKVFLEQLELRKEALAVEIAMNKISNEEASRLLDKWAYKKSGKEDMDKQRFEEQARLKEKYDPTSWFQSEQSKLAETLDVNSEEYKYAMADLRAENYRFRADMGETWGIAAMVIRDSSQHATDAMHSWMLDLDGLGISWKTLGDTVRNVISGMLMDMSRMMMQKQVMEPLFNGMADFVGNKAGLNEAGHNKEAGGAASETAAALEGVKNNALAAADSLAGMGGKAGAAEVVMGAVKGTTLTADTALGTLATSAYSAAAALASMSAGSTASSFVGPVRAAGGPVLRGSRYLVGEYGPEVFEASSTGRITPNGGIGGYGGGYSEANVNIVQNIQNSGPADTKVTGSGARPWAEMAKGIEGIVRETIAKEQRLGNSLNPVMGRGR